MDMNDLDFDLVSTPTILCSRFGFFFPPISLQPPISLATNTLSRQEQSALVSRGSDCIPGSTTLSDAFQSGGVVSNLGGFIVLFLSLPLAGSSCAGANYGLLRLRINSRS